MVTDGLTLRGGFSRGTLLHVYEETHHQLPNVSGAKVLRSYMDEHGLTQADLPEISS